MVLLVLALELHPASRDRTSHAATAPAPRLPCLTEDFGIKGVVRDAVGTPLEQVYVQLGRGTMMDTDAAGEFGFCLFGRHTAEDERRSFSLEFSKFGYDSKTITRNYAPRPMYVNVTLLPSG